MVPSKVRFVRALPPLVPLVATVAVLGCTAPTAPHEDTAAGGQPIVGGAVDEETKGVVGLAVNFLDLYFIGHCSGSLIAPNLVLTAQHCVSLTEDETPGGSVVCGTTDFGLQAGGQVFRVTTETVRPEVDGPEFYRGATNLRVRVPPETDNLCGYDVALIILEGAGVPAKEATPLVPRIDSAPAPGDEFVAVGYGLTAPTGGESGTRMRAEGNVVTCVGEECGSQIYASEWSGNSPVCPGDSGGPALDAEGRVMGVTSRGPADCMSAVYGDVSAWKELLIDTALEAAELGGIEPPFWALTGESTPPAPAGAGEACLGICVAGNTCASMADGSRRCVPSCDSDAPSCPDGYACDAVRGACLEVPEAEDDSGCSVAGRPRRVGSSPILWLVALAFAARRRRR